MNNFQGNIKTMLNLAHQRTDEARLELAGMLADTFLDENARLNLREQELVNELIDQLLQNGNQSPALRAKLVEKFADLTRMPRKIALSVVTGDIKEAGPVLTNSKTLLDDDFLTVIRTQSRDHAAAIAQRQSINEAVADALVVTGDLRVMRLVAENLGAHLGQKAIDVLTDAARFTATLRESVMKRPEMKPETAAKLYWWVSQDLRRYALKQFNIDGGQIEKSLAKTIEEMLGFHHLDKNNDKIMEQVADWLEERQALSSRILPQVLRLGHFRLFNILLARLTHTDLFLMDTIINESGGRGLAVVCRSLGIDKAGFVSMFLLSRGARAGEQVVHPRELSFALAAFDKLSISLAHDLLHSWKENPGYLLDRQANELALEA